MKTSHEIDRIIDEGRNAVVIYLKSSWRPCPCRGRILLRLSPDKQKIVFTHRPPKHIHKDPMEMAEDDIIIENDCPDTDHFKDLMAEMGMNNLLLIKEYSVTPEDLSHSGELTPRGWDKVFNKWFDHAFQDREVWVEDTYKKLRETLEKMLKMPE